MQVLLHMAEKGEIPQSQTESTAIPRKEGVFSKFKKAVSNPRAALESFANRGQQPVSEEQRTRNEYAEELMKQFRADRQQRDQEATSKKAAAEARADELMRSYRQEKVERHAESAGRQSAAEARATELMAEHRRQRETEEKQRAAKMQEKLDELRRKNSSGS